jgi:hypothetical protein
LSGSCQEGDTIYAGVINAIYVAYGRPFHWCRDVGRLVEEDLPPETLLLHNELIHLRDKLYAHKDLNGYQVESEIFNTVKAVVIGGRITLFSTELLPRGPKLHEIRGHVNKLVMHFDTKAKSILQQIRSTKQPADGEYVLNMDASSEDFFKTVPESEATMLAKRMLEAP